MFDLSSTLGEAIAASVDVYATCHEGHEYKLDLQKLADLVGPFSPLDQVVLTKSWCPHCGQLASAVAIKTTH